MIIKKERLEHKCKGGTLGIAWYQGKMFDTAL